MSKWIYSIIQVPHSSTEHLIFISIVNLFADLTQMFH